MCQDCALSLFSCSRHVLSRVCLFMPCAKVKSHLGLLGSCLPPPPTTTTTHIPIPFPPLTVFHSLVFSAGLFVLERTPFTVYFSISCHALYKRFIFLLHPPPPPCPAWAEVSGVLVAGGITSPGRTPLCLLSGLGLVFRALVMARISVRVMSGPPAMTGMRVAHMLLLTHSAG